VAEAEELGLARRETCTRLWHLAHQALGEATPELPGHLPDHIIPHLSEAWFCCAEPTAAQLRAF
jgi:hypothetical protein